MPFTLPDLPYSYDALEPVIDARTMEIHHSKHHQGYVTKANDALKGTAFENETVETVLTKLATVPDNVRNAVRNNAGGHANHSLFWEIMAPKGEGGEPSKGLMDAIVKSFNSFDAMKQTFSDAADELVSEVSEAGETPVVVVVDGAPAGVLGLFDEARATSAPAVRQLRALSLATEVLSGDHQRAVDALAADLGIQQARGA